MFIYIYAYTIVMTKIISLSDEAYDRLKSIKGEKSFTKIVIELTEPRQKRSLLDYASVWKDNPEMDEIFKRLLAQRAKRDPRMDTTW